MAAPPDLGINSQIAAREIESAIASARLPLLSPDAIQKLAEYLRLLLRWNSRLNLTSVREPSEIVRRHFLECIQCAQVLPQVETLLDFGSGAGLPGVPIAIVRPEIRVTLGESQGKKAAFLSEVTRELRLNAEIYNSRIEAMASDLVFDAITLRAVDKMAQACRIAVQRLDTGGWIVIFATTGTESALETLSSSIVWKRKLPTCGLTRGLLLMGQKLNVSRGTTEVVETH
jgi:16S rRNA (guanine527-N7)-methyltransferase